MHLVVAGGRHGLQLVKKRLHHLLVLGKLANKQQTIDGLALALTVCVRPAAAVQKRLRHTTKTRVDEWRAFARHNQLRIADHIQPVAHKVNVYFGPVRQFFCLVTLQSALGHLRDVLIAHAHGGHVDMVVFVGSDDARLQLEVDERAVLYVVVVECEQTFGGGRVVRRVD
ncbi:hypothetical protein BpHYR1_038969 [Brachionus plicatilis]|uniref:Uncharacterized protein n=1 Tax=Brachionus plicatilis TaxID=10195 RepID=A0A3M7QCL6_BRAPC|nr:hypothetical protein BpHYR1_038969 [Brachionus plicatilis]